MSPTVFRYKSYHFLFFSREEARIHIHVTCPDGEAKFWLEPKVVLVKSYGLNSKQLKEIGQIVEERKEEITKAWEKHFKG
ncbi:MAG: DUF4160 domain-containing protein [Candidatus Omnitrophica bacterium]|nr:DUF4160 domain-containing protein [Candidatus Omnitrophota bacterium]